MVKILFICVFLFYLFLPASVFAIIPAPSLTPIPSQNPAFDVCVDDGAWGWADCSKRMTTMADCLKSLPSTNPVWGINSTTNCVDENSDGKLQDAELLGCANNFKDHVCKNMNFGFMLGSSCNDNCKNSPDYWYYENGTTTSFKEYFPNLYKLKNSQFSGITPTPTLTPTPIPRPTGAATTGVYCLSLVDQAVRTSPSQNLCLETLSNVTECFKKVLSNDPIWTCQNSNECFISNIDEPLRKKINENPQLNANKIRCVEDFYWDTIATTFKNDLGNIYTLAKQNIIQTQDTGDASNFDGSIKMSIDEANKKLVEQCGHDNQQCCLPSKGLPDLNGTGMLNGEGDSSWGTWAFNFFGGFKKLYVYMSSFVTDATTEANKLTLSSGVCIEEPSVVYYRLSKDSSSMSDRIAGGRSTLVDLRGDADPVTNKVENPLAKCTCFGKESNFGTSTYSLSLCRNITNTHNPNDEYAHCEECSARGVWTALGCIDYDVQPFINNFIFGYGIGLAGIFSLMCIGYASFTMQTSVNNPEKIKHAQDLMTSCITGLLLVIFSVFILRIIGVDLLQIPGFGK